MNLIRQIGPQDIEAAAKLYVSVYEAIDVGERWTHESAMRFMRYWHARQPELFVVAEAAGTIVGGAVVGVKPWWDGNHLIDGELFVDPGAQGQGIGRALVKRLLENAIEKYGAISIESFTFRNREFPLAWYKRLGFVEKKDWVILSGDVRSALAKLDRPK